jgi:hypothetical protein
MDTNKKSFFTYGANLTVSRKSCVESVALLILFLTPSIFIGGISIFVIVLSIMIVGIYIKSIYGKFDSKRLIRGHLLFLHNGMLGLCMTFSFLMMGIRILLLLYPPQYHLVIVVMVFLFILIVLTFYILWTNQLIKKGRFKNVKAVQGGTSFIVFAVLGRAIARETTKGLNNEGIFKFLAICCFILVSLTHLVCRRYFSRDDVLSVTVRIVTYSYTFTCK